MVSMKYDRGTECATPDLQILRTVYKTLRGVRSKSRFIYFFNQVCFCDAMGDFRVHGNSVYFILLSTIVRAVIGTGLGKCPIYPQLPNYDIRRVSYFCFFFKLLKLL